MAVCVSPHGWNCDVFKKQKAHIKHRRHALTPLPDAGVSIKLNKYVFLSKTINYLSHFIHPANWQSLKKRSTRSVLEAPNEYFGSTIVPGLGQLLSTICTQLGAYCSTAEQKIAEISTYSLREGRKRLTVCPTNTAQMHGQNLVCKAPLDRC